MVEPGFRSPVGAEAAERIGAGVGRAADDRTAAFLAGHLGAAVLDAQEGTDVVELHRGADRLDVAGGKGTDTRRAAGAGEKTVEPSGQSGGGGHGGLDRIFIGDIGDYVGDGRAGGSVRLDAFDRSDELLLGASADHHVGSVGGKLCGRCLADAAAATRHEHRIAVDGTHI